MRVGEGQVTCLLHCKPIVLVAAEDDPARALRDDAAAALPHQLSLLASPQRVTTPRGLAHHRERGVLVRLERFERVGDEEQVHDAASGLSAGAVNAGPPLLHNERNGAGDHAPEGRADAGHRHARQGDQKGQPCGVAVAFFLQRRRQAAGNGAEQRQARHRQHQLTREGLQQADDRTANEPDGNVEDPAAMLAA